MRFKIYMFMLLASAVLSGGCRSAQKASKPVNVVYRYKKAVPGSFHLSMHYIYATLQGDSLHIKYMATRYGEPSRKYPDEILPAKACQGKNLRILKVKRNRIKASISNNQPFDKKVTLKRCRHVGNFDKMQKSIAYQELHDAYNDSAKKVLRMQITNINPLVWNTSWIHDNFNKYDVDTYPLVVKKKFEHEVDSFRNVTHEWLLLNADLVTETKSPDSAMFAKLLYHYCSSYYENRLFYTMVIKRPDLFFLHYPSTGFLNDCISYYYECFTRDEINEMYCKLKPYSARNPDMFHMFDKLGKIKCE